MRLSRTKAREGIEPAPLFVLVEPQMGENIGAAARAMLNFGVSGLRLVNPRDGWPNAKASAVASGAAPVIDQTEVFETVDQAISDCDYVIATTARQREVATPVLSPGEASNELRSRVAGGQRCAVLFGGERNGLSSDDVARANAILSIPVNPAFASLNLAQGVLITAYEWSRASNYSPVSSPLETEKPASREEVSGLVEHLQAVLDERGHFFPPEKSPSMKRNLRAALTRAGFTEPEVRSLRGVVKALAKPKA
ncbi:MAG: tRNA (cytidine/uridine-2'-O-)-methyltransferase TrmJ [Hyphococcus sp.]|nr:MAG: tRNA (cytidine/uridine-2'-O-)-methyltransferase TrmJ [Marinicaulis sp.]